MKKYNVLAKFIGQDGSMGYRYGKNYRLEIKIQEDKVPIFFEILDRLFCREIYKSVVMSIEDKGGEGMYCPYDSMDALFDNWMILESYE